MSGRKGSGEVSGENWQILAGARPWPRRVSGEFLEYRPENGGRSTLVRSGCAWGEAGRKLQLDWQQVLRALPQHLKDQAEAEVGVVDAVGVPPRAPLPASPPVPRGL